jgi:hypothetical protein
MAFIERLVHVPYGLNPVPMEFLWGSLKLPLGFLQMMDGRLDPRMLLRRRTGGGYAGRRRGHARLRRHGLRVKNKR